MTKEQTSIERAKEICKADGMAIAKHLDETLSADTIIKQLVTTTLSWSTSLV